MIEPARFDTLDKNFMQPSNNGQKNSPDMENNRAFQVQLDRVFLGPLDLLLQLVKEKELEMKSFKNQSIIGLLLLVILGFIVF